jgi:hypothetical protein
MNTERAAVLADTLAGYRQNRHLIRGVEIISDCCPTCDLDSHREFAVDAVPPLPHPYCTNPDGCQCFYSAVPLDAPSASEENAPVVYPPPVFRDRAEGLPAYLRTPAAAMILVGASVIFVGIGLISFNSIGRDIPTPPTAVTRSSTPPTAASRRRPVNATRTVRTARARPAAAAPVIPVSTKRGEPIRDRDLERKAARDIREAESNARANEAARRAQEVAAQQQAYLRTVLSRQAHSTPSSPRSAGRPGQNAMASAEVRSAPAETATP